ncbi:indole-3-glycerol phosphate synthase TrpC [Lacrimispora defluvii]|uniref:Indole-3-glycerol phosphate synthase n=1 Tax=Lacrimispora defluvii TaxID=2719233 RepID=A0ABX1VXS4_9FIRM|nr:indole-3-glycerol phosphate synthase TrpC [Lacrimispora defluvii]NNJ31216.1 indole-3-glycerol phosphate synthase TrpC [Lacrimispora defluvii]
MILDTLAAASRQRAEEAKITIPISQMKEMAYMAFEDGNRECDFSFEKAISSPGISFICEVKRASPSKGMIASDFPYREIAMEYEEAGADAISVLTEPDYFLGKGEYLTEISRSVSLPLLRKDFTVDSYQIFEAKVLGASAVLLICALLDTEKLKEYMKICDSLGLSALVEAHDEKEIHSALTAGARLIGVNNRNLKTFEVDFENSIRLRNLVPAGTAFIAESGIQTADDVKRLCQAGVNGVLIGESLMRSPDKKAVLQEMRKAANEIL